MKEIVLKEYQDYIEDEVISLYKSVHWNSYVMDSEKLKESYDHSLFKLAAYHENLLVGMIRVVGDGISIIFIQDLLIHPEFQRRGVGTKLMKVVLEKYKTVRQKALLTDDRNAQKYFYRSVGLVPIQETKGICFVKYTT